MKRFIIFNLYTTGIILLFSSYNCKETTKKDKHSNKIIKNKNGKRWMNNFSQNFMSNEPEQYGSQVAPDSSFGDSYGYNMGGSSGSNNKAEQQQPNFQGMEELKIPKQSYSANDEAQSSFAQDVASYLRPGIGDYPSDMPGGLKGFETVSGISGVAAPTGISGIGTPINPHGNHKPSNVMNPVSALVQAAMEDAALNPQATHKQGGGGGPVTMELTAVAVSDAMNNDEPAKVTDSSGKPSASLGSIGKVDSDSNKALDKEPAVLSKEKDGKVGLMKEKTATKYKEDKGKSDSAPDNKEKEEGKEKEKEKEKVKEEVKETVKQTTKDKDKEVEKEIKELSTEVENKDKEDASKIKEKERNTDEKKEKDEPLKKSKKKEETGARRQNYEDYVDSGNNRIEHIGLPALKVPVEFTDADEKDVLIDAKDGSDIGEDGMEKTPSKVKAKLVSSLRAALLKNVKELMDSDEPAEDSEYSAKASVSNDKDSAKSSSDTSESSSDTAKESSADDTTSDLLENNLMKIDKKKLVHLLATMMKKRREKGSGDEEKSDKGKESEKSNQLSAEGGKDGSQGFIQLSSPESQAYPISYQPALSHSKHHQKTSKYGLSLDPYAQIGLADPNNNDEGKGKHTGRHSVHQGHEKQEEEKEQDKDEGKAEKETEDKESDSPKEDNMKNSKAKDAKEKEKAEEVAAEKERETKKEDKAEKEKAAETAEIAEKEKEEEKHNEKEEKENAKLLEKQKQKQKTKEDAANVEAEVEKERQELKKLREEEKEEKEKESTLKASNAELEGKHKGKQEDSDKAEETTDDEKPMKLQHGNLIHLVSPELVSAIAENLKSGKGLSSSEQSEEKEQKGETKEEDKEKSEEVDTKSEEGPNIQKLIENMKEKLLGSKAKGKSARRHKGSSDDAYAEIGASDPNLKRRGREKKHRVRHPHKH